MGRKGWFKEPYRHYLAAKGIKTARYAAAKTAAGRFLEHLYARGEARRKFIVMQGDLPERQKLALERKMISAPLSPEERRLKDALLAEIGEEIKRRGGVRRAASTRVVRRVESPSAAFARWVPEHTNFVIGAKHSEYLDVLARSNDLEKQMKGAPAEKGREMRDEIETLKVKMDSLLREEEQLKNLREKMVSGDPLTSAEKKVLGLHTQAYEAVH